VQLEDFSKVAFRARSNDTSGSIAEGLRWVVAGHVVLAVVTLTFALLYISVIQLSYVVPLAGVFHSIDRKKSMYGVALGALVGVAINGIYLLIYNAIRGLSW